MERDEEEEKFEEIYPKDIVKRVEEKIKQINEEWIEKGMPDVKWHYDFNYYKKLKQAVNFY